MRGFIISSRATTDIFGAGTSRRRTSSPANVQQFFARLNSGPEASRSIVDLKLSPEREENRMKRDYRIINYGKRMSPRFSIDRFIGGEYTHQVAFWFKRMEDAERCLMRLITEDIEAGVYKENDPLD